MQSKLVRILFCIVSIVFITVLSFPFQSCVIDPDVDIQNDTCTSNLRKPNIYIYPTSDIHLTVTVTFPRGGKIVESIPLYTTSWDVNVDTTGKIDNQYDYLFYETKQPDYWQYETGWLIERNNLNSFFQANMTSYGFNQKEIKDFTDYWIPLLKAYKYYLIYPQEKDSIDKLVKVDYSIKPDNLLRLFYAIKGTNTVVPIQNHIVKSDFRREKFHITEWGVTLKE
jgi:hypothetical protein